MSVLNEKIMAIVSSFKSDLIGDDRKGVLTHLVNYIAEKQAKEKDVRLNFICTHNSRRSHLTQIWAQTMADHFNIQRVTCYSGGTEATAMFLKVAETLQKQGFEILTLSNEANPVYCIKHNPKAQPIICFSKKHNHSFNPANGFAAIMTCDSADENCPIVIGADARIPIKYSDPKAYDNTPFMDEKYEERSLQIGQEMWWVFQQISQNK